MSSKGADMARWWDYARLMRVPNIFTAVTDGAMGYLVTARGVESPWRLACLLAASAMLYAAGMVWNDYFDVELDRRERPERPLPSGRISLAQARRLGVFLLVGGVASGVIAGGVSSSPWITAAGILAGALAGLVLLYDRVLKPTPLGPLGMGACRSVNVWMGMAVGAVSVGEAGLPVAPTLLAIVVGMGIYVAGITWFARDEAGLSQRGQLAAAAVTMAVGLTLIAVSPWLGGPYWLETLTLRPFEAWPLLVGILSLSPARRWWLAWRDPQPRRVQMAIKESILFLIVLDAALVLAWAGPPAALCILALVIPARWLGAWFAST